MEGLEQGPLQDEWEWLATQVPDETWKELGVRAAEEPGGEDSVDTTVADFYDAYCRLRTHPDEWPDLLCEGSEPARASARCTGTGSRCRRCSRVRSQR